MQQPVGAASQPYAHLLVTVGAREEQHHMLDEGAVQPIVVSRG